MAILHVFEKIQDVCPLEGGKCGISLEGGKDFVLTGDWEQKLQEGDKVLIDLDEWSATEKATAYVFRENALVETIHLDASCEFNSLY